MGIGERQSEAKILGEEQDIQKPLKDKDLEYCAHDKKQHMQGMGLKASVPLVYVLVGALILVILGIVFLVLNAKALGKTCQNEIEKVVLYHFPDDWILYNGKVYHFSENSKTWNDSQDYCKSLNLSLVVIDNQKELAFLNNFAYNYWIGLTRAADDSGWVSPNGTMYSNNMLSIKRKQINPGETEHVFLNGQGFKSESGKYEKKCICSNLFSTP